MIGTIKIHMGFRKHFGNINPKLLGMMLMDLPLDSEVTDMFMDENECLNIQVKSEFFVRDGDIKATFKRHVTLPEGRSIGVGHDCYCGLDFTEVMGE